MICSGENFKWIFINLKTIPQKFVKFVKSS